jgi:hypothetical protein
VGFQTAYVMCNKDIYYSKAVCLQKNLAEKEKRSKTGYFVTKNNVLYVARELRPACARH